MKGIQQKYLEESKNEVMDETSSIMPKGTPAQKKKPH